MKRLAALTVAILVCAAFASTVWAYELVRQNEWVPFDGTRFDHRNGVRMGNLSLKYSDEGLTEVKFRVTALRGRATLIDMYAMSGDASLFRLTDRKPLNIDFHAFESVDKHYEETVAFDVPLKGFTKDTGKIVWYYKVGNQRYAVTWAVKTNTFTTAVVKEG